MYPIRTERDTGFINWLVHATAFSTVRDNSNKIMYIKSDGVVRADFAQFNVLADVTLLANQVAIAGIHLGGPLESGSEYSLYEYNCSAYTVDPLISLALVCGMSSATPSTSATDTIDEVRYLHLSKNSSDEIRGLEAEGVIALASPFEDLGAGFEERGICFGIAAIGGLTSPTAASHIVGRLSVRRLVGELPTLHDKFKLG